MGHEWLPIVLADVAIGYDAGLGTKVASELATIIILYMDALFALRYDGTDRLAVERDKPLDLQVVGDDSFVGKLLDCLAYDALRRTPTNQCDLGIWWSE